MRKILQNIIILITRFSPRAYMNTLPKKQVERGMGGLVNDLKLERLK